MKTKKSIQTLTKLTLIQDLIDPRYSKLPMDFYFVDTDQFEHYLENYFDEPLNSNLEMLLILAFQSEGVVYDDKTGLILAKFVVVEEDVNNFFGFAFDLHKTLCYVPREDMLDYYNACEYDEGRYVQIIRCVKDIILHSKKTDKEFVVKFLQCLNIDRAMAESSAIQEVFHKYAVKLIQLMEEDNEGILVQNLNKLLHSISNTEEVQSRLISDFIDYIENDYHKNDEQ